MISSIRYSETYTRVHIIHYIHLCMISDIDHLRDSRNERTSLLKDPGSSIFDM